ncbi:MAG: hypothetical protein IJ545_02730 [Alphaproteobacteria bacterium]|nr:hypothetical protein [Alphaproteobacteria bacterium]
MKKILFSILLLSGCAGWFDNNKTPLTPQGQMNVCIRDEVRTYKDSGRLQAMGEWGAAQKIANDCTKKYNLDHLYTQAVNNARDMMKVSSEGTSLRR